MNILEWLKTRTVNGGEIKRERERETNNETVSQSVSER